MAVAIRGPQARRPHPDGNRVAGYSAAILINAMLLMLLLVPMQGPPSSNAPGDAPPAITWYMPQPRPVMPPPEVPVSRPQPPADSAVAPRPAIAQAPDRVVVDQGSELAEASTPPDADGAGTTTLEPPAQPLPGVRLEYAQAPAPAYPRAALRQRVEGTVLLEVLVDVDGRPLRVTVREGSGDRRLDAAARDQVLAHWRFRPAMRDGRAMQAIGLVPINFRLR